MADRGDSDGLVVVCELVDDAIRAHAQRAEAVEPAAERVSRVRIALEKSQRVLDGVDLGPVELEQFLPGAPGENDSSHASAGGSTFCEITAEIF